MSPPPVIRITVSSAVAFAVVDLLRVVGKLFVVDGAVGTVVGPCTLT